MTPLPKLSAPAQRALAAAHITCVEDLAKWRQKDVAALHGIGPASFKVLKPLMKTLGVTFLS